MVEAWGFLTVLGSVIIYSSFGFSNTVGNMNVYLIPFMTITAGQAVWFSAASAIGFAIAMPLGGWLESHFGFRTVLAVGCILGSGGVALSSVTVSTGLVPFIATYAVIFGSGMGLSYAVLFTIAPEWFPKQRALVIGLILAASGLGQLVFTPIQTVLINPNNKPTDDATVTSNVPTALLILAAILFGLQVIGLLLLRKYTRDEDAMKKDTRETFELTNVDAPTKSAEIGEKGETSDFEAECRVDVNHEGLLHTYDYSVKEALKSIDFYLMATIFFLATLPVNLQTSAYKVFGATNNLDDRFLSIIATCTSIFNCAGRVVSGLLCDHFSFKLPLAWFLIQWALLFVTLPLIVYSRAFHILYAIWVSLLSFTMAGHYVYVPDACNRIFGSKNSAIAYGLLCITTFPGNLILAAIMSKHDIANNFPLTFYCCGALCFVCFLLALFLKDEFGVWRHLTRPCVHLVDFMRYVPPAARDVVEENSFDSGDGYTVAPNAK